MPGRDGRLSGPYFLKHGYVEREDPEYDFEERWGQTIWQPDVYPRAVEIARRTAATRIVDVGCGNANKLEAVMGEFQTVGLDIGSNLDVCRARHPEAEWLEHDLDTEGPLPATADGAVVVCADVIEHVRFPERLLGKIRTALDNGAHAALVSTPERDLTWGLRHSGPPPNRAHVREWAWQEFSSLLSAHGFHNGTLELTRSRDRPPHRNTILAVLYP